MRKVPESFFNNVVAEYWDALNFAGQRLLNAYTNLAVVPATGQLPLGQNVNRALVSKQINVYLFELIGVFVRKEGNDFVWLDFDSRIDRARWKEDKNAPDPLSLMHQYFDALHECREYRERWLEGQGGGVPSVARQAEDGSTYESTPTFSELLLTYTINLNQVPFGRPSEKELGPTIEGHEVIYLDCMHNVLTDEVKAIPGVLAARDKVAGCRFKNADPASVDEWSTLFEQWVVGRHGHEHKPDVEAGPLVERLARSLLGCLYKIPGDDSFPYVYGPSGTGKSLLQNSFSNMAGEYSTEVTRQALCMNNNTSHSSNTIQIYNGARVAVVKEAKNDAGVIDTELIKDITSYEPGRCYAVRGAYDRAAKMYATAAKPFFISNDSPQHMLDVAGIDRRLCSFPFLSRYVETGQANRDLPKRLVTDTMATSLIRFLLQHRDAFLEKGSTPAPGENTSERTPDLFDVFVDLFCFKQFLTVHSSYDDSVSSRDLLEIRAYMSGYTTVREMLAELGVSRNKATRLAVQTVKDLVVAREGFPVALGDAKGGKRVLLNVALTDKGRRILGEARLAMGD